MTDKCCVPQMLLEDAEDNPKYNIMQHFDKVSDAISMYV